MDPVTVIVIVSVHLVASGGLLLVVGQRTPDGAGLGWFGSACVLFGIAFASRLVTGAPTVGLDAALVDSIGVLAMLLFHGGLARFAGQHVFPGGRLVATMLLYVLASLLAMHLGGAVGRHVLYNAALGGVQLAFGVFALRLAAASAGTALHLPLASLGGLMAAVAAVTLLRAGVVASSGIEPRLEGVTAQLYSTAGSLVPVLVAPLVLWLVFVRMNARLAELATRDPLTRLLNRGGLDEVLRRHFGSREPLPVAVLQVDIDRFKRINDRFGHDAGDAVLRAVATTLAASMRGGDFAARTGGEEFVVGCVSAQADVASALADRLRDAVAALRIPLGDGSLACTISVGVSMPVRRLADWPAAMREADRALYAAKDGGRDRVVVTDHAPLDDGETVPLPA